MKCSIIQDLLPLYCDDMASEDSRKEIEKMAPAFIQTTQS